MLKLLHVQWLTDLCNLMTNTEGKNVLKGSKSADIKKPIQKGLSNLPALDPFSDTDRKINPLSAKLTKWPNTLKQFVGNLPTNCLSVFGHFVGLALKELILITKNQISSSD